MNSGWDAAFPGLLESGAPPGKARLGGVLIHGRDRTREDKVVLATNFDVEGVRWLAPAAEEGTWYPGRFFDPRDTHEPYLTEAVAVLDSAVEAASESGRLGPERLVMVGFSQGACLAVDYALQHPGRCRTFIVFTGALIGGPSGAQSYPPGLLAGTRILLTGSDADEWITEEQSRATGAFLTALGADVRLHIYHGRPHLVSPEELQEASDLIRSLL